MRKAFSIVRSPCRIDLSHGIIIKREREAQSQLLSSFFPLTSRPAEVFIISARSLCPVRRQQMDNTLQLDAALVVVRLSIGARAIEKGTTRRRHPMCVCASSITRIIEQQKLLLLRVPRVLQQTCSFAKGEKSTERRVQLVSILAKPGQTRPGVYCDATASSCKIRTRRQDIRLGSCSITFVRLDSHSRITAPRKDLDALQAPSNIH